MKRMRPLIPVGIIILVMFILWSVQPKKSHDFTGNCELCHVGLKDPSILTKEIDHLCLSCHPDNAKRSHPSGIFPAKTLPAKYPTSRGKMVCTSCHFPHEHLGKVDPAAPAPQAGVTSPGPYLLRAVRAGKVFCYSCHQGGFTSSAVDSHAITLQKAHTPVAGKGLNFEQKQLLDDKSRECLSCHDGTISSHASAQMRGAGGMNFRHRRNIGMSHPICFDYEDVYLRKPREYHPPERLDPRIQLINGKVGCTTCHNHYSKNKKHLVMDNIRSRLCLSCHNL